MGTSAAIETCSNCGREWPSRFGDHNCNFRRVHVHNNAIIIQPGSDLFDSVQLLAERFESETKRSAEYANLAGEGHPYRDALARIDASICFLKHFRADVQRLAGHAHKWNSDDYCDICGADGRA